MGQQFLEESASQLTYHGLCELNTRMRDGELAVFFRNNHFSTIYKQVARLFSSSGTTTSFHIQTGSQTLLIFRNNHFSFIYKQVARLFSSLGTATSQPYTNR